MATVTLKIDGKTVVAVAGRTVLQAAREGGIRIPTLCDHPALPPEGGCRICLVELEGQPTLQPACTLPVSAGLIVQTRSPRVVEARKLILELLLSDHPLDCLTCESTSSCLLQDLAYEYGVKGDRYRGRRHDYPIDASNPFILVDRNKCILCRRCSRACSYINGVEAINLFHRGFDASIGFGADGLMQDSRCEFCGSCVAVCPTGALRPKMAIGKGRPWQVKTVETICSYCGVGCKLILHVKDNEIIGVEGASDGPANHGWACVKGRFGHDYVNSPDRLSHPRVRRYLLTEAERERRGDGWDWVEADWETALTLAAKGLNQIREKYGADSIGVLCSAKCLNEENYLMNKLARQIIGTNNIDHCARLCHSSTVAGLAASFGSGAMTNSIEDVAEQAAAYLVIGSNTTEQHPIIGFRIRQAVKQRGARLIVADPRQIDLADFAWLHLRHRPGTDVALLNGLMYLIVAAGLEDKRFIAERTEGFESFRAVVGQYPPEKTAEITGVQIEQLEEAAEILATNKPAAVVWAMGITQHVTGVRNVMTLANLQMLLGNMGLPGGGVNPLRGQNNVQGACDMGGLPDVYPGYQKISLEENRKKFEAAWGVSLPSNPGRTVTELMPDALEGKTHALYILGEDPVMSDPDTNHVRKCLEKIDFLVLQEIFASETAAYADILFPGASFAEKSGSFTNTERRVQMVRQALDPPGEARPDWLIVSGLAKRLLAESGRRIAEGAHAGWDYNSTADIMEEVAALTPSYAGISHARLENGECPQWPVKDAAHSGTPILHVGKFTHGLGRFMPIEHIPAAELPDNEYPTILTTGRVLYHWHGGQMSRRAKGLLEAYPKPRVEISAEDAARLQLHDRQRVRVLSRRGRIEADAMVTDRVPPGMVFANFHFPEASANELTHAALDPVSKIPEYKVCAVRVEKV
jgi:formate dehydrogenase alpha subunit